MMQRVASYPGLKQENVSPLRNKRNKSTRLNVKKFSGLQVPKEHRSSFMEVVHILKHTRCILPRKRRRVDAEVQEVVTDRLSVRFSERGAELRGNGGLQICHILLDAQVSGSKFANSTTESKSEGLVLDDEKMSTVCEKDHDSSTLSEEGLGGETQEWDCSQVETNAHTCLCEDSQEELSFLPQFRVDEGFDCSTMQQLDHFPTLETDDPESLFPPSELSPVLDGHRKVSETVNGNLRMKQHLQMTEKDLLATSKDISSNGRDVSGQERDEDSNVNIQEQIEQLRRAQNPMDALVAGREAPLGVSALEFLFLDATSMSRVVGVGMDYAKVLLTSPSEVEVNVCGEEEWKELWSEALNEQSAFKIMAVKVNQQQQQQQSVDTISRDAMSENEMAMKFGVGLKGVNSDEMVSYLSNTDQKSDDDNANQTEPLLLEIAQHMMTMMMKEKMRTSTAAATATNGRQHTVSGADEGNHNRQENQSWETGQAGNAFNLPSFFTLKLDPRRGNSDGDEDSSRGLPQELATMHEKPLALRVRVQPGRGGTIITNAFQPKLPESLSKVSAMFPTFTFDFKKHDGLRTIDVKVLAECALGEGGPKLRDKDRFGWYHDYISISFKCLGVDESILHHYEMQDMGDIVGGLLTKSTSDNSGSSWQSQLQGQATIPIIGGLQVTGSETATRTLAGSSTDGIALDTSNRQVSKGFNYQDLSSTGEAHLLYRFFFHRDVPPDVWKSIPIRRWFNQTGICSTFRRTIFGKWEPRSNAENTPYLFKMERELCEKFKNPNFLAGVAGVSENSERKYMQEDMVPLYVNHAMTHLDKVGAYDQVLNEKVKEIPKVMLLGQRVL